MENLANCPKCNSKLKGMISSKKVEALMPKEKLFAQRFWNFHDDVVCTNCIYELHKHRKEENGILEKRIIASEGNYRNMFPLTTTQNPKDWEYKTLGLVTAQTTMDNKVQQSLFGVLFGVGSNVVNLDKSVNDGEAFCIKVIKQKTLLMGGNAILGVDIDYCEFGLKGELMLVCMSGTAVKVKDGDILIDNFKSNQEEYLETIQSHEFFKSNYYD